MTLTMQEHANHIKYIAYKMNVEYDFAQTRYYEALDTVKKTLDQDEHPLDAVLVELGITGTSDEFNNWLNPRPKEREPEKEKPKKEKCPKCGGTLKLRNGTKGPFMGCINYPDCNYTCNTGIIDTQPDGSKVLERVKLALAFIEGVGGIQKAKAIIAGIDQLDSIK